MNLLNSSWTRNKECGPKAKFTKLVSKFWHSVKLIRYQFWCTRCAFRCDIDIGYCTMKNFILYSKSIRTKFSNFSSEMVTSEYESNINNGTWNKLCWMIYHMHKRTKITNSNQSHKSYKKYKLEDGRTRTSEYIRGGIRCHGGETIPCWPVTPTVSSISKLDERYEP
jgi:hypothetical protein